MKTVAILSGSFTQNGNFSGYNAAGQRIHISGRTLEAAGIKKGDTINYPLYALVVEREFDSLDENGNPTGEKFKREQAGSVFTTKAAMIEAANADKMLAVETAAALKAEASAAGISEQQFKSMLEIA